MRSTPHEAKDYESGEKVKEFILSKVSCMLITNYLFYKSVIRIWQSSPPSATYLLSGDIAQHNTHFNEFFKQKLGLSL